MCCDGDGFCMGWCDRGQCWTPWGLCLVGMNALWERLYNDMRFIIISGWDVRGVGELCRVCYEQYISCYMRWEEGRCKLVIGVLVGVGGRGRCVCRWDVSGYVVACSEYVWVCCDMSFVTLCMCYICHVMGSRWGCLYGQRLYFMRVRVSSRDEMKYVRKYVVKGQRWGKGGLMFRREGHSSRVGVSCRQVSPCYVILLSCGAMDVM